MSGANEKDEGPSWDECATTWDDDPRVERFAEAAFAALLEQCDQVVPSWRDRRCLDFGAGTGQLSRRLAPLCREIVAVDLSAPMLAVLEERVAAEGIGNIRTLQAVLDEGSVRRQEELEEPFALIVASSVCNFLPDFPATLRALASLLSPGGLFVQWDWQQTEREPDFGMSAATITSAYATANLEPLFAGHAFSLASEKGAMPVLMGVARRSAAS